MRSKNFTVLCLHGHPGSGDSMNIFTQYFQNQGFKVLSPNLRGYGKSKASQAFTMQTHIDDLVELLEKEKVEHCLVLGWSLGGILAMELAWRLPKKIAGLILIATAARPLSNHPAVAWWEVANTAVAVATYRLFPQRTWAMHIGRKSLLNYLVQQHTKFAYDRIANEGASAFIHTSKFATQALSTALRSGYNRNQDLNKLTIPCLMMAGECDRHIMASASQETAELLPNCQWLCYPHTAHLLPWEIPEQILANINLWISSVELSLA